MRVRTTIILLLLLAGTAFVAGLVEVRRSEMQKFEAVREASEKRWRKTVDDFWKNQNERLLKMLEDLPSNREVVSAILANDSSWAQVNWSSQTLGNSDANVAWVYRPDGTLFYSQANTAEGELQKSPFTPDAVHRIFIRERKPHFYLPLQPSNAGGMRVLEVHGIPVQPAWDTAGQQPPEGYFLAGRIWDNERLRSVMPPGNDEAVLLRPNTSVHPTNGSELVYPRAWRDWQGRDVAVMLYSNHDPQLALLDSRGDRVFSTLLLAALALFFILFLLLESAVVRPLRRVIRSLHSGDLSLLDSLRKQEAEFGELARLIQVFFAQQMELVREMGERHAAEKALRDSEEMLRHSQKMEAVGRLAGGVAHDFNNLLTAIIGYADLLRQRFADTPGARQPADLIHQAGEQAAGLTRQLLAFSRKQLLQPKVIDLNLIITNLQRLLQRIIGEHIQVVAQTGAQHPRVKADPGQIEQVIVNLGVNARDAMPRGGNLTIRTRDVELTAEANPAELPPGFYVALEVRDTGEGMDEETKARIFEPFFTTKGPGKGTGLGLATVYGIVMQSHGGIVVESERGKGSTFRILLPREDGPIETVSSAPIVVKSVAKEEAILLVEDEEIVRELVCEILRGEGYYVLATDRGSEALRMLREEQCEIDLLISDVVMPEMNGAVVAQRVRELCPRVRVLFVSGYSENDMADQGLETLSFQVLQKPFTPDTLARKVREVLDLA
jgi:signal transduction histidine kinase